MVTTKKCIAFSQPTKMNVRHLCVRNIVCIEIHIRMWMRVSFSGDKGLNASVRFFLCTLKMLWNFFVFYSKFPTFVFFFFCYCWARAIHGCTINAYVCGLAKKKKKWNCTLENCLKWSDHEHSSNQQLNTWFRCNYVLTCKRVSFCSGAHAHSPAQAQAFTKTCIAYICVCMCLNGAFACHSC